MPIIEISNLPLAPTRKMSPEQFVVAADAHVASLTTMVGQLNAAFDQVEQAEANADADAKATAADRVATAADRAAARGSAELAAAYAGAAAWSPATVYPADAVVFSPSTRLLYRRKAAGSSPTDPANDGANWASVILSVAGNPVWHSGNLNPGDYLSRSGGTMTGPLNSAGVSLGSGYPNTAEPNPGGARLGQMNRVFGSAIIQLGGAADNSAGFEVIDRNWTTVILGASMGGFTYKGSAVWHAGNVNPLHTITGALRNHDANARTAIAGFTYNNNAGGVTGPLLSVGHPDYLLQIVGNYNSGMDFLVRTRQGDGAGFWNPWRKLWHDGNLNAGAIMYDRGASTDDAALAPGYYRLDVGGYTRTLLSYNAGGSTGTMQVMSEYQGRIWWRNKTDNAAWTGWKEFYHTGNFNPANFTTQRLQLYDGNAALTRGNDYSPRFETPWGWVEVGPKNSTACHIYSDSPMFYFNRHLATAGRVFGNGDGGVGLGRITVTTSGPVGGSMGDIWVVY